MPRAKENEEGKTLELLQDLLITLLATAGVKQAEVRKIVGCSMKRVNRIMKHIEWGSTNGERRA